MARKILNTTIPKGPERTPDSYFHLIRDLLRIPANGQGASYAEMAVTVPVIQKLDDHKDEGAAIFEDAEHALIVQRLKAATFKHNAEDALTMIQSVIDSPVVDLNGG